MNAPQQQHYVPRFLLKNFAAGKKPRVWVYDKSNDKTFRTNIKNVAAESGFYDIATELGPLSFEPALSRLEMDSAAVIARLLKTENLKVLEQSELATLALFLAVQFVRTKEHRLRYGHLTNLLAQRLRGEGESEEPVYRLLGNESAAESEKTLGLTALVTAHQYMPLFLNKTWALLRASRATPFFISDNPLTLHNESDYGPYGNLGLAVRGIEIYVPLSTTICLWLLCPSIASQFFSGYDTIKQMDVQTPGLADSLMPNAKATRDLCQGFRYGTPISTNVNNVTMVNSLQVTFSSRFVFCEAESFALVRRMIADNAKYREALRPTLD